MSTKETATEQSEQDSEIPHPPMDDADRIPQTLSEQVRDAIDAHPSMPKATSFEPLAFDAPDGWRRTACMIGGNVDIDGHFEYTKWEHPFYSDIIVSSKKGADTHEARADGYAPFYVGSRYVAYLRACQHISECHDAPTPSPTRLENLANRTLTATTRQQKIESLIRHWSEDYPTETIKPQVLTTLRRAGAYATLHRLKKSDFIEENTRSWAATVGTPIKQRTT